MHMCFSNIQPWLTSNHMTSAIPNPHFSAKAYKLLVSLTFKKKKIHFYLLLINAGIVRRRLPCHCPIFESLKYHNEKKKYMKMSWKNVWKWHHCLKYICLLKVAHLSMISKILPYLPLSLNTSDNVLIYSVLMLKITVRSPCHNDYNLKKRPWNPGGGWEASWIYMSTHNFIWGQLW